MARKAMTILYGVSFALHASLGAGFSEIEPDSEPERLAISVVEAPKPKPKEQPKEEPPPPPPPPAKPKAKPLAAKAPEPTPAPAPAPAVEAPTFGISMSGGVGMGGVAVPLGDSLHAPKEPIKRVAQAKTLAEPKQEVALECADAPTKPKPLSMGTPEYTEEARAASIEGVVVVEVVIGPDGTVTSAKVLESLGYGLDEAALAVARAATFEPATQCGKPVQDTKKFRIRFSL